MSEYILLRLFLLFCVSFPLSLARAFSLWCVEASLFEERKKKITKKKWNMKWSLLLSNIYTHNRFSSHTPPLSPCLSRRVMPTLFHFLPFIFFFSCCSFNPQLFFIFLIQKARIYQNSKRNWERKSSLMLPFLLPFFFLFLLFYFFCASTKWWCGSGLHAFEFVYCLIETNFACGYFLVEQRVTIRGRSEFVSECERERGVEWKSCWGICGHAKLYFRQHIELK